MTKNGSLSIAAKRIMVQDLFISGFLSTNLLKIITSFCSGSAKHHCNRVERKLQVAP